MSLVGEGEIVVRLLCLLDLFVCTLFVSLRFHQERRCQEQACDNKKELSTNKNAIFLFAFGRVGGASG